MCSKENSRGKGHLQNGVKWPDAFSRIFLPASLVSPHTYGCQSSLCIRIIWATLKQNNYRCWGPIPGPSFYWLEFLQGIALLGITCSSIPQLIFICSQDKNHCLTHILCFCMRRNVLSTSLNQALILTNINNHHSKIWRLVAKCLLGKCKASKCHFSQSYNVIGLLTRIPVLFYPEGV